MTAATRVAHRTEATVDEDQINAECTDSAEVPVVLEQLLVEDVSIDGMCGVY